MLRSDNVRDEFPLSVLSGTFADEPRDEKHLKDIIKNEPCQEDHLNQISFYKCSICNPDCYINYEHF